VTCNLKLPKWKGFLLKITSLRKLQMKFCPTWKFKIFLSHFQKVQDHEFLMYGWRDMDQSWPSVTWTSNMHNFQTKRPNGVVLFATFFLWLLLSKTYITCHEFSSHNFLENHLILEGKIQVWIWFIVFTFQHLHWLPNRISSEFEP
jgi:hypothetical protein